MFCMSMHNELNVFIYFIFAEKSLSSLNFFPYEQFSLNLVNFAALEATQY